MTPADRVAADLARFITDPDQVTELRALHVGGRGRTFAGWFDGRNLREMARHALALSREAAGVYFVPNPVDPSLLARRPNTTGDVRRDRPPLTRDADVLTRRFLILDVDPRRNADDQHQPSTDAELDFARHAADTVYRPFMKAAGYRSPVVMLSGNGVHLIYPLSSDMVDVGEIHTNPHAAILRLLSEKYQVGFAESGPDRPYVRQHASVDPDTYKAAQKIKVPGTMVRKGEASPDRPYRTARIIEVPDGWPDST